MIGEIILDHLLEDLFEPNRKFIDVVCYIFTAHRINLVIILIAIRNTVIIGNSFCTNITIHQHHHIILNLLTYDSIAKEYFLIIIIKNVVLINFSVVNQFTFFPILLFPLHSLTLQVILLQSLALAFFSISILASNFIV